MLALIFLLAFPFALWKAWKNIQMAKASTGWPMVSGTVTASERAKVMFRKQPRVSYSYSVEGTPFTGTGFPLPVDIPNEKRMQSSVDIQLASRL
jgi:hypothetical protein